MCQPKRRELLRHTSERARPGAAGQQGREPHTAHAARVHRRQLLAGNVRLHHRDPTPIGTKPLHGIEGDTVVGAMRARLHDHRAPDTERRPQLDVSLERRCRRGVAARLGQRKALERTDDVAMRIADAGRDLEFRLMRVRIRTEAGTHVLLLHSYSAAAVRRRRRRANSGRARMRTDSTSKLAAIGRVTN